MGNLAFFMFGCINYLWANLIGRAGNAQCQRQRVAAHEPIAPR